MCSQDDRIRLRHMLDAASLGLSLAEGETRQSLDADVKLQLALVRLIEIIGEAVSGVSEECQQQNPDIPWRVIKAMRNRLIHAYFAVDLDLVWDAVVKDLPRLVTDLEQIIPPDEEKQE